MSCNSSIHYRASSSLYLLLLLFVSSSLSSSKCIASAFGTSPKLQQKSYRTSSASLQLTSSTDSIVNTSNNNNKNNNMSSSSKTYLGRSISKIVSAKIPSNPMAPQRMIGTVDIDGAGTPHNLAEVNPFMLLDSGIISKDAMPPFGLHPHRGHSVVTLLMQGTMKSYDTYTEVETPITGPASYWVDANSGLFHDETSIITNEEDTSQHVALYQLWITIKEQDRLKVPTIQSYTNIPLEEIKGENGDDVIGTIRYYVGGSDGGDEGNTKIQPPNPIIVAHVTQKPNTTYRFPLKPNYGGFIAYMTGSTWLKQKKDDNDDADSTTKTSKTTVKFGCSGTTATPPNTNDVLVLDDYNGSDDATDDNDFIDIVTTSSNGNNDDDVDYLICVGEKIDGEWYKKLVANGAVIAKTPEEAREIALKVEMASKNGKDPAGGGSFEPFGISQLTRKRKLEEEN